MHLIDIYIQEVTRRLPEKNRNDIALELQSTIEDMLPENFTEEDEKEALAKLGSPVTLASGYLDRPMHLIGPYYFGIYVTLLKMILPIAATIALIVSISESILSYNANETVINIVLTIIGKGIVEILSTLMQSFFWITIIFAILERANISNEKLSIKTSLKDWTPDDLKRIPSILKEKKIPKSKIFGSLLEIAILTVIYFNGVKLLGVYENTHGKLQMTIPSFNEEVLQSYWLIVVIGIAVEVALVCYKFVVSQWTMKVATLNIVRHVISSIVFIVLFSNSSLINPDFIEYLEGLLNSPFEMKSSLHLGLILLFVAFAVIDVIKGFRKANISS
ncbi:HAAS signaling domain-containing protein [Psychrobacillus sp. L3]|uniref:HAAS signaling domain-containing protein n=1 Tax=Psychrobacillus sp. L3 TaxID=3236891 RepID=UPI0036F31586